MAEVRPWRTEGQRAHSEQKHGKWILWIWYRTSQTHRKKSQYKKFRSDDPRYDCKWETYDAAMAEAEAFTEFVQRGFVHPGVGGSRSTANSEHPPSFDAAVRSPERRSKRTLEQMFANEALAALATLVCCLKYCVFVFCNAVCRLSCGGSSHRAHPSHRPPIRWYSFTSCKLDY